MLPVALVFVAVIGLCAGALLEGGLAFARVSAHHAAQRYAEIGLIQARAQLVAAIASQIASGATTLSAPAPLTATSVCNDASAPCPFTSTATFQLSGSLGGAATPNTSASNLQTQSAIEEGRVAATIVETVGSTAGAPLATRTQLVTLRTFSVAPFVAIDGVSDAAAARDVPTEADAGGCSQTSWSSCDANNASSPAPAAPIASMDPGDTRIHALTQCVDGGSGACAGQTYVSADPTNTPASTSWFNANAQSNGWSP